MKPKQTKEGCWWKGQFIEAYAGCQPNVSSDFNRGGLPGLSRTLKADTEAHAAGVCVEYFNKKDMGKIYRIRKLTPRECFRLMGVSDKDIDKIQAYPFHELIEHPSYSKEEILAGMTEEEKRAKMRERISESQQYKMAGNSIVVQVLEGIFTQMFRKDEDALF